MKIRILCILSLVLYASLASAQIQGIVVAKESQEPLASVEVIESVTGQTRYTDNQGYFEFERVNEKGTRIFCFKEGYRFLEFVIDSIQEIYTIKLNKLEVELSGIEIVRKKQEIFATKKLSDKEGTSIFAGKKTEVVVLDLVNANTATNISRQVYAQISGLNIYEGSDGGLQLNVGGRGLDPNRTSNFNTRQNGYDISADVLGYPENYYTPPSDALEEIRILRGASSLQYGTQFGGLIDFRIRQIPKYRNWDIRTKQTVGSYNFLNSFNSIGFNKEKFSIDCFYNYKQGNGYRDNSAFNAHNAFLSARYQLSDRSKISAEITYFNYLAQQAGGLTDMQFDNNPRLSTRDRNWFNVDWQLYNLKFHHNFGDDQELEINLFGLNAGRRSVGFRGNPIALNENPILSIDEQDSEGNYINPRDLVLGKFRNIGAEAKYLNQYQWNNLSGTYLIGAKYYNSSNMSIQGPGTTGFDADFSLQNSMFPDYANQSNFRLPNLNLALFAENIFYITDKLSLTPGVRLEYIKTQSEGTYQELVFDLAGNAIANVSFEESRELPRQFLLAGVGLDYRFSNQLKYSFNISQNYRSVTFSDIRVVNPTFIVDENISDEKGFTLNTGITGRVKSRFSYDLGVYSILYKDRIGIRLDDRANRERTNIGNAIIVGTESLIDVIAYRVIKNDQKIFQLKYFVNSSFTFSEYLNSLTNNVVGNSVEFIPSVNIKSGVTIDYKKLGISLQYSYVSKQFTDAQNSLATTNGDFRSGIIGQIPSYQVLDFSLSYTWNKFSLESGFNNLLNQSYYTRRATGYPGPGIIPSEGRAFYITLSYIFQRT